MEENVVGGGKEEEEVEEEEIRVEDEFGSTGPGAGAGMPSVQPMTAEPMTWRQSFIRM